MYDLMMGMTRSQKRALFLFVDSVLIVASLYAAYQLRFGGDTAYEQFNGDWELVSALVICGVVVCYSLGLHRIKLHAFENRAILLIGAAAAFLCSLAVIISYFMGGGAPRSVPLIFGVFFFGSAVVSRLLLLAVLNFLNDRRGNRVPVAIYGAGAAGIQLASGLRQAAEMRPVMIVDDNASLWGLMVSGMHVGRPSRLAAAVAEGRIEKILLAMPSTPPGQLKSVVERLSELDCEVQVLSSYAEMLDDHRDADEQLRVVAPDDLLGRDKVELDSPEVAKAYAGRVVMVTGAGGSIGSELCRQLMNCAPAKIVLYEQSEFGLYEIDADLRRLLGDAKIEIVSRLGSVTNPARVRGVIVNENVEIVLHAAAYKHVPIVERNELEGARNNILGTQIVAEEALAQGVERFILVSTDKAVRPTNVMGATKRLAELVVQDLQSRSTTTKFSMVRFGNVLGSSGSVLPLFERQIKAGGPVTVTHPEVTRFFMTIPEASRLVLLAGAFAQGGDVFVLDMGEPRKIMDIARRMIAMSGRTVREDGHGDIEIRITGLRPGEKLYEELLIDDDSLCPTPHEKIMRAEETKLSQIEVAAMLRELRDALENSDPKALRDMIVRRVEGYHLPVHQAVV